MEIQASNEMETPPTPKTPAGEDSVDQLVGLDLVKRQERIEFELMKKLNYAEEQLAEATRRYLANDWRHMADCIEKAEKQLALCGYDCRALASLSNDQGD